MDMHSGGGCKEEPYEYIYIEASEDEAVIIFFNRFGHNPNRVSCTCCGEDYSIRSHDDLLQLTGFDRGCRSLETPRDENGLYLNDDPVIKKHLYLEKDESPPENYEIDSRFSALREYQTLDDYKKCDGILFVPASEIKSEEQRGEVAEQGYVWME